MKKPKKIEKTINEALSDLTSFDPKVRAQAAEQALDRKFRLAKAPKWFTAKKYPDVVGYDQEFVIYGTCFRNFRLLTWEELKSGHIYNEEFVTDFFSKVA